MNCAIAFFIVFCAFAAANPLDEPAESQEIIDYVNNAKTTWKAARNFSPNLRKRDVRRLLGVKAEEIDETPMEKEETISTTIPTSFDARKEWKSCKSLKTIKDQSDCGSCWAVSAAATFSDRLCIASGGDFNDELSAGELLSCCWYCGDGCDGGYLSRSWLYFRLHGIVTGGLYGSADGCQPYPLEPCEHHVNGSRPACADLNITTTPSCVRSSCTNSAYTTAFKEDNHKVKVAFHLKKNVTAIQQDIMTNGPVQAAFSVYSDFLSYSSGVYQRTTGSYEGGHAVKIIGWGTEDDTDYWLVANSWNTDWGLQGFFKIIRGTNNCGIEGSIHAGIPSWTSS